MLSERPLKYAHQKTERGKVLNPQYSIDRDQRTSRASPLRINTLLFYAVASLVLSTNRDPSKLMAARAQQNAVLPSERAMA